MGRTAERRKEVELKGQQQCSSWERNSLQKVIPRDLTMMMEMKPQTFGNNVAYSDRVAWQEPPMLSSKARDFSTCVFQSLAATLTHVNNVHSCNVEQKHNLNSIFSYKNPSFSCCKKKLAVKTGVAGLSINL